MTKFDRILDKIIDICLATLLIAVTASVVVFSIALFITLISAKS